MRFKPLLAWSLPPAKFIPDMKGARLKRDLLRTGFAHVRAERQPEFCPPWVQGQALGWRIASPIDVVLTPLMQYEVPFGETAAPSARAMGGQQHVWIRDRAAIATTAPPWLTGFEFDHGGEAQSMFIPNGLASIEWRLGWAASDHDNIGLLVIPSPSTPNLGVEIGYFSPRTLDRIELKGLSIAVSPDGPVRIERGQEIARLIPINREALAL